MLSAKGFVLSVGLLTCLAVTALLANPVSFSPEAERAIIGGTCASDCGSSTNQPCNDGSGQNYCGCNTGSTATCTMGNQKCGHQSCSCGSNDSCT